MPDGIIRFDDGWRLDAGHRLDQPPVAPSAGAAPVTATKKGKPVMDWLPRKRTERLLWWRNLHDNIEVEGPKFGLAAGDITATKTLAAGQIAAMEATDAAKNALDGERASEAADSATNEAQIRANVRNWKTLPGYAASGSEGVLQLRGPESGFDPNTYKPVLKVSVVGGQIRVDFVKSDCDGVAIYCRLRGTPGWTRLGTDTYSPYYDTNPLANPAVPEVREYMGRGVIDDIEIGLDSDIVSLTLS
ncbi:MAG: hypothetical protein KDL87_08655 [Verrucomicrobiae bacterium]|nr:hypothetical protein [Verrucomicrobiae bacterium]